MCREFLCIEWVQKIVKVSIICGLRGMQVNLGEHLGIFIGPLGFQEGLAALHRLPALFQDAHHIEVAAAPQTQQQHLHRRLAWHRAREGDAGRGAEQPDIHAGRAEFGGLAGYDQVAARG